MTEAVFVPTDDQTSWRSPQRRRGFCHGWLAVRDALSGRWIKIEITPDAGIRAWSPPEFDRFDTAMALAAALQAAGHTGAVAKRVDDRPKRRWLYLFRSSTMGLYCHILGVKRVAKPYSLYRQLLGERLPWQERAALAGNKALAAVVVALIVIGFGKVVL